MSKNDRTEASSRWVRRPPTLSALALLASLLGAQASNSQTEAPQTDAIPPAGSLEAPPEKIEPDRPIGPDQPLSQGLTTDELRRSGGVLQPPPTPDGGMTREPPNQGATTTPVIPPRDVPGRRPPDAQPR